MDSLIDVDDFKINFNDVHSKIKGLKTKEDVLKLYIKFGKKQRKILEELNEKTDGYTIVDFKLKLINDNEAMDLLTQMRLIANNHI